MLDQQERSAVVHAAPRPPWQAAEDDSELLVAFSAQQVRELTGLSEHQLRYWDQADFVTPSYPSAQRRQPLGRIYRFRDVVSLRLIAMLRNDYQIPLPEIRNVAHRLREHENASPALLRFFVRDRQVALEDSATVAPPIR
ncbi:MAG: MerR family transcriptional regulator [Chloroflexota bacterium]